jgi:multisubunit Na+/H+ antiporter MnhC subunit
MTLVATALIVIGAALSVFATSLIVRPAGWARATGTITGLSASAPSWAPYRGASFTYTSDDGTEHTVRSPDATAAGEGVGRPVQVRYDAKDPANARTAAPLAQVFVLIAIADVIAVVGVLLLVL